MSTAAVDVKADAERVFAVIARGGLAITPLDVAYGIFGNAPEAIRKIFTAKGRSYEKPSGMVGNLQLFDELHQIGDREREMVRAVVVDAGLPLSVVAPFDRAHRMFETIDPFSIASSTKTGTLDLLLNAGILHDELARLSYERGMPILGSSANTSLTGSRYEVADIDKPVLEVADIVIDYGRSKYHNPEGISSSIVDLTTLRPIRRGVCFEQIKTIFRERFGVDLERP